METTHLIIVNARIKNRRKPKALPDKTEKGQTPDVKTIGTMAETYIHHSAERGF